MRGGDHPDVQFAAWNVTEEYCENIYIKVLLMVHFVFLSNSILLFLRPSSVVPS